MLNRKRIVTLLVLVLMLALSVTTVFAAPPLLIHIEVLEWIGSPTPEPFIALGTAVNDGLVCAAGEVEDYGTTTQDPGGPFKIIRTYKHFTCADLSGSFDMKMVVKLDKATNDTTATWKIISGTGSYTALKGNGKLIGLSNYPVNSIFDIYDGKVH